MKKLLILGAACLGIFTAQNSFAEEFNHQGGGCPPERSCNDCWCRMVRYQPCYYCTQRCVEEQVPCVKKCCRMVPQYYQVQRCRMVPQYYCVTCCRHVPENYCVTEYKCCKRYVTDRHCKYVPCYYWKHVCGVNNCPNIDNNNSNFDNRDNRDFRDNGDNDSDNNQRTDTDKQ